MIKDVLKDAESRMKSAVSVLEEDLMGLRTGRASTGLVEKLRSSITARRRRSTS